MATSEMVWLLRRCGGYFGDVVATFGDVEATFGDVVATLVARQTSEAEVPGSNPASPTMILGRCRIIV